MLRYSKEGARRLGQGNAWEGQFGGSEANVAVSLALLGNNVEYVTRLPDNDLTAACKHTLRYRGVDVNHIVLGGQRIGTYYYEPAKDLRRSKVIYDRAGSSFYSSAPGMYPWKDISPRPISSTAPASPARYPKAPRTLPSRPLKPPRPPVSASPATSTSARTSGSMRVPMPTPP